VTIVCADRQNGVKEKDRLNKNISERKGKSFLIIRAVHFAGESNKYCLKRNDKVYWGNFLFPLYLPDG
jgi:hypothetical protein